MEALNGVLKGTKDGGGGCVRISITCGIMYVKWSESLGPIAARYGHVCMLAVRRPT